MDAALAIAGAFALGWILNARRMRRRFILTNRKVSEREAREVIDAVVAHAYDGNDPDGWLRAVLAEETDDADGLTIPPLPWEDR